MRGPVSDTGGMPTGSVSRVGGLVPGLYADDPLFAALCAAFDDLLAPVLTALDCFPAYLDPTLAPTDFLAWLGDLVGVQVEPSWSEERRREQVGGAVRRYRMRGTAAGLREVAAAAAGVPVTDVAVEEPGAVVWSPVAGGASPPAAAPVGVRVVLPPGSDVSRVAALVRDAVLPEVPVHCRVRVDCQVRS